MQLFTSVYARTILLDYISVPQLSQLFRASAVTLETLILQTSAFPKWELDKQLKSGECKMFWAHQEEISSRDGQAEKREMKGWGGDDREQ